ncbi:MAG: hypothetical protein ABUS57_06945 [Pseudomonadota bacterium]
MKLRLFCVAHLLDLVACASPDPMAAYYANSVLVTQPYGETDPILLSADHTYVMYGRRFGEGHGTWSVENGQVCLMPADTPETRGQKFCNAWTGRKVGDRWSITVGDQSVAMELAPGRQTAPRD